MSSSSQRKKLRIGLAVGYGTGPELVDIFKRVIHTLARYHNLRDQIEFYQSPRQYHSYLSLLSVGGGQDGRDEETLRDVRHYSQFCKDAAAYDIPVIFRTAITAQSLYLVRLHLVAVKVELFSKDDASLLLIRDQAQGFYTGSNICSADNETITRSCQFSKQISGCIVSYALKHARHVWGNDVVVDCITMVYKHHLFNGIFDDWAKDWEQEHGIKIEFVQPDTMNRNLLAFGVEGKRLVIAGSEYADIMEIIFLKAFGQGPQETSYAENVYLHPDLNGLSEYQTVHGSADDLVGKNMVNPSATIRAAAAILERYAAGCEGTEKAMDETLQALLQQRAVTPDQGGLLSTSDFVDLVLSSFGSMAPTPTEQQRASSSDYGFSAKLDLVPQMVGLKAKL